MAGLRLGLKSSFKDLEIIAALKPAFLETYLGPRDLLDLGVDQLVARFSSAGVPIIIHVPEYHGDVFIDIASDDPKVRKTSLDAVRGCIKIADGLHSPHIVLHPGGISEGKLDRPAALKRLRCSLNELSYEHFFVENMPWFYFRARSDKGKTRQVRSNIMIDVSDYGDIQEIIGGMTLDICHGFLSTKKGSMTNLLALFDIFPDMPRYLHLSDALPPDGEGIQLGKGAIDLVSVINRIKERGEHWWGIPEIMEGHKNGGAGFVEARNFLRKSGL